LIPIYRKPADFAILRGMAIDSTDVQKQIMEAFPAGISYYMSDFGFSPIHVAVLGLYEPEDSARPSLQELINFIDDANNAPPGNDWAAWRRKDVRSSPLYSEIVEMFRSSATELSEKEKPIIDIIDQSDKKWGWPPFHWAAFTGRREQMEILISNNTNPFILSPMERNALHIAAESKRSDVLSFVLDIWENNKDILDINKADHWMETPLHVAAQNSEKCVELLLAKGVDPNARQENGQVALHYASICPKQDERLAILNHLVSVDGIQVDFQDEDGRTPVFEFLDSPACVQLLVKNGADLSISDNTRSTVVHYACIEDEVEALETILELSSDPGAATRINNSGNTPLLEAFSHRGRSCVRYLLERQNSGYSVAGKDGWSAIHHAAKWGDADILKAVLTHPQFKRGQKTADGKSAEQIAKEGCMWKDKVKELLKRYDSLAGTYTLTQSGRERSDFYESTAFYLSMR
jgi:ankyrin repeat protein